MMISTRGRYALRVMVDLAEHAGTAYVPMKDVAARQEISLKYLEQILPSLTAGGLVKGRHGKGGGYRLRRSPEDCTVWEILTLSEGDMAPVTCLEGSAVPCDRAADCRTLPVWQGYYDLSKKYFSSVTLADLMAAPTGTAMQQIQ